MLSISSQEGMRIKTAQRLCPILDLLSKQTNKQTKIHKIVRPCKDPENRFSHPTAK